MRRIYYLIFTFVLIFTFENQAQELSVNIQTRYGILAGNSFETGGRGGSFGIDYLYQLKPSLQTVVGAEMSLVPWGTNLSGNLGLKYTKEISPKWNWTLKVETQQGIALFRMNELYAWGLSGIGGIEYKLSPKSILSICTGLRYTSCPAYKSYGLITNYLDLPVEIAYRLKL